MPGPILSEAATTASISSDPAASNRKTRAKLFEGKELSNIDIGKRLAQARRRFYSTASEAARALGIPGPTYLAHENGTRGMRTDMAEFYAQKYAISTDWLLYGRGPMERTAAGAAYASPQQAPVRDIVGPELLLAQMDVSRDSKRVFFAPNPASAPARLPLVAESDGYVVELAALRPQVDHLSRKVGIQGDDDQRTHVEPLAFRDIYRLPPDMLQTDRAFVVKLPRNDLLGDMPGGQRVIVDPDDIHFEMEAEGLFVLNINATLAPAAVRRIDDGNRTVYRVWRSRSRPAQDLEPHDFLNKVVGRMFLSIAEITAGDVEKVIDAIIEKQGLSVVNATPAVDASSIFRASASGRAQGAGADEPAVEQPESAHQRRAAAS